MLIGISQREIEAEKGANRDALEQDYVEYWEKLGITLIPISNKGNFEKYTKLNLNGIILSGGNDTPARDRRERELLDYAIANKIPVLGVCKGIQFVNLYFGGNLKNVEGHVAVQHKVKVDGKEIEVNSYHNDALDKTGDGLEVFATAFDGTVEGVYHPEHRIAAIMWHPERGESEIDSKLVKDFLERKGYWE